MTLLSRLQNSAVLSFRLRTDGPLLINSGDSSKIDPTLPDMRFVRCTYKGKDTVYMPGSGLKGVFRTRYEQLAGYFDSCCGACCNVTAKAQSCWDKIEKKPWPSSKAIYDKSCEACRLFGSLGMAGRISFADAYPVMDDIIRENGNDDSSNVCEYKDMVVTGIRNSVGIDRITGGANSGSGALFEYEVVENALFQVNVRIMNFQKYQLRLLLWVLEDIDDGFVTFGMGGSRGNGQMRLADRAAVLLRYKYGGDLQQPEFRGLDGIIAHTEFNNSQALKSFFEGRVNKNATDTGT